MAFKIFVDANVLLDFSLKREKYDMSKKLIQHIVDGDFQAFITPSIVHIIGYWLSKAYGSAKAKMIILELLTVVQIIDSDHSIVVNALSSAMDDIEDSLQYYTALHNQLDFFITQYKHLQRSAIPVLPIYFPEQFLELFAE